MKPKTIKRLTVILLLVGFGAAAAVFFTARPEPIDPLLGDYRSSKRYQRELKMIGGEANVLVDDFQEWLGDQWHGRELARTLVVLTIGATLLFRVIASHPDHLPDADPVEKNPDAGP